jgi:hypothetical protein
VVSRNRDERDPGLDERVESGQDELDQRVGRIVHVEEIARDEDAPDA